STISCACLTLAVSRLTISSGRSAFVHCCSTFPMNDIPPTKLTICYCQRQQQDVANFSWPGTSYISLLHIFIVRFFNEFKHINYFCLSFLLFYFYANTFNNTVIDMKLTSVVTSI